MLQGVDWPAICLQQAEAALQAIQAAMAPADERALAALLYEVWVSTAKPTTATEDQQAVSTVYVRELRTWPGDIALHVLRQAKRTCHWFPPLADLCEQLAALARKRQWLLASLQDRMTELERPALPVRPLQPMPGTAKATAARKPGHVSWSPRSGNIERLAKHLDITPSQARARIFEASAEELADYEAVVRQLAAAEDQVEASESESAV